jgi:hypothetical protein
MNESIPSRTFVIDGHQVTATFSESGGAAVIEQVKQILLSAYVNHFPDECSNDTLAISEPQRDNMNGGSPNAP